MPYDPARHHRRSIRLPGYDYTQAGAYFVTVVTHQRECLFGDVVDGAMHLNACGDVALTCWRDIPRHFPSVQLDAMVVMPNHVHGVLWIVDELNGDAIVTATAATAATVGAQHAAPLQLQPTPRPMPRYPGVTSGSLAAVVRSYKSAVTKSINAVRGAAGDPIWQRNYYEHIIRDEPSLNRIRHYIDENPSQWAFDDENPQQSPQP